ncbi:MAG: C-terminal target protein [Flavipsychrobacter sp.]|nr:C-terminal target protein [Flavipsychrobacter sp.]
MQVLSIYNPRIRFPALSILYIFVKNTFIMGRISILIVLLLAGFSSAYAQTAEDVAVELRAVTQLSPAKITLHWKPNAFYVPTYYIFKKAKTATSWGTSIATVSTVGADSFVDNSVVVDSAYEYQVAGSVSGSTVTVGYIYAGIKAPAIHNRGALVLVVDSTFTTACAPEIQKLMGDLSCDGWQVIRHDFYRTSAVTTVKAAITNDYAKHPDLAAVLLLGHVPVPYSGDQNPDGHPDHLGAWPADVYYGSITGTWTDVTVNDVSAGYAANKNTPADGKWDQIAIPSGAQLQVGRIDFYDMPAFTTSEVTMMKSYLAKDHMYKMDSLAMRHRGIVSDNFGYFSGEAFASNGWRNFAPIIGADSITVTPSAFISSLAAGTYQWAYATGGGSFTSASGIGSTTDFTTNPVNGIFCIAFGSYFGDWNVTNSFLRAPLCSSTPALTNCWAGRPNWFMHHMALGDNIGYTAKLTHNNTATYGTMYNYGAGWVHIALMGDLSLRTDYIQPARSLAITTPSGDGAHLTWTASADPAVIGYYIYRADTAYGYYQRLNTTMLSSTTTTYHDYVGISGKKYYQVRPVKLQSTPSGAYYNLGLGVIDSVTVSFGPLEVVTVTPEITLGVFPNPAQENLTVSVHTNTSVLANMYMVNMAGVQFMPVTKQLNAGENMYSLDIANMPPGMYSLVVNTGANVTVKKWVKL